MAADVATQTAQAATDLVAVTGGDPKNIAIALIMAFGGLGPGIAIGLIGFAGLQALGRNPEASGKIQTNMVLGFAFAEALAIYALVVALILKFV